MRKRLLSYPKHNVIIYKLHQPRLTASGISQDLPNQSVNFDALSESTAIVGGGLSISPNGITVLRVNLHNRVVAEGFPAENFVFKDANGWTLGMQSTSDKAGRAEGNAEEVCIARSRHSL